MDTFFLLFLILVTVYARHHNTCIPSIQTCRNCYYAFPLYCPIRSESGHDEDSCANLVPAETGKEPQAAVYNYTTEICELYSCHDFIQYSPHTTLTVRSCFSGCRYVSVSEVKDAKVSTTEIFFEQLICSETECLSRCLSRATVMNTTCTMSFNSFVSTCIIYTSCASSQCLQEYGGSTWTVFIASCGHSECSHLTQPQNGFVSATGILVGDIATYQCQDGFYLSQTMNRTCLANGSWTGTEPECELIDCGRVNAPENGTASTTDTTYLSNVTYACSTGYKLIGDTTRTCEANASWSGTDPYCLLIDCGETPTPIGGYVSFTGTTLYHVATYNCSEGYWLSGENQRICLENSSWSNTTPECILYNCRTPEAPTNGYVSVESIRAFYSCNTGFNLSGESSSACLRNNTWDEDRPSCFPVDCGPLGTLANGTIYVTNTTYLSQALYLCNIGFSPSYTNSTCQADGSWSSKKPVCQPIDCGNSQYLENGKIVVENTSHPVTATYICDTGYILNGANFSICLSDGNWSSSIPVCEPVDCGPLDSPENGSVLIKATTFLHTVTYECEKGYTLSDQNSSGVRVCLADGYWNGTDAECIPTECPDLVNITNGLVNMTFGRQFGHIVTYTCESGYMLNGADERICLQNGNWSGEEPVCEATNKPVNLLSTSARPNPRRIYIMPCLCNINRSFENIPQAQILHQLVTGIRINKRNTTLALDKRRSKHDNRKSSAIIGVTGVVILSVVLSLPLLNDAWNVFRPVPKK